MTYVIVQWCKAKEYVNVLGLHPKNILYFRRYIIQNAISNMSSFSPHKLLAFVHCRFKDNFDFIWWIFFREIFTFSSTTVSGSAMTSNSKLLWGTKWEPMHGPKKYSHLIDLTVYECTNVLAVDKIAIFKYIWIFWQFESIFYCQRKKLKTDNKQDVRLWDKMNDCTISLNKLNEFCLLCVRKFCSREILHFLLKVIAWFFRIWILKIEIWKSAQIFNM